ISFLFCESYVFVCCFVIFLYFLFFFFFFFFFFQAEDGIRDFHVTGVQTCALPISASIPMAAPGRRTWSRWRAFPATRSGNGASRSEERRVGKECRYRWSPDH